MKSRSNNHDSTRTTYIQLDTKKCIACWECLSECKNNVIGRINLPWHKHSKFVNSNDCTGCLKCVNICEPGALTKISNTKPDNYSSKKTIKQAFIVNIGLFFFAIAMSFSGFVIQFKYHMGHNFGLESDNSVLGIGYYNWTSIHKASIIIISILMTYHFFMHWKWYKTIIIKKLSSRNKLQMILSIIFILVAITGFIPWIINLSGGSDISRKFCIEIHDKIAILLFVLLTVHMTNRLKWYVTTLDKL
jgi:2-oxoglutarate ferredoxin oxidoreductase subunit delta